MKERSGPSAPVTAIAAVTAASVAVIIVVMPEERGEELPLLDLHESFV